jgi:hypothetical protein
MSPEAPDLPTSSSGCATRRAGVALSVSCGLYPAAYCLTTWAQPHRGTIPAVALGAVGGSPAMCAALAGTGDGARAVDDVVGLV